MSTAQRTKPMTVSPLVPGQQLDQPTFHDRYAAMPPETRAELVRGVVYLPSPMRFDHGDTRRSLAFWFGHYQWKTPGVAGADGATVILDLQGEPQPDHVLIIPADRGGQTHVDDNGYLAGPPELVLEVARSTRSFDLNQKKTDNERAGVREYVVVELKPNLVHWFIGAASGSRPYVPGAMASIGPRSSRACGSIRRRSMPVTLTD
jgi:hypothetical protein